jgi:hypothetical protein
MSEIKSESNGSKRRAKLERRAQLEALEAAATGSIKHIGHLPIFTDELEGWTFRRCRCGSTLAQSPAGRLYWLRMSDRAMELLTFSDLLAALAAHCWQHPRKEKRRSSPVASSAPAPKAEAPSPADVRQGKTPVAPPTPTRSEPLSPSTGNSISIRKKIPPPPVEKEFETGLAAALKEGRRPQSPPAKPLQVFMPSTPRGLRKAMGKTR